MTRDANAYYYYPNSLNETVQAPIVEPERIQSNLDRVRERIDRALDRSGRKRGSVRLVAVTKSVGVNEIRALYEFGISHVGENRVEVAESKMKGLPATLTWHMIGPIQRRKAKDVVRLFQRVDAIDRIEVAQDLDKRQETGSRMPALVEVNVSGETSKHGFTPSQLSEVLKTMRSFDRLDVQGLMTMAPYTDNPESTRNVFAELKHLADQFQLGVISMGMSNDFEIAIEEGATEVRIGSALFE